MICYEYIRLTYYVLVMSLMRSTADAVRTEFPLVFISWTYLGDTRLMPFSLSSISMLTYPMNRIALYFQSFDTSVRADEVLCSWIGENGAAYHDVTAICGEASCCLSHFQESQLEWGNHYGEAFCSKPNDNANGKCFQSCNDTTVGGKYPASRRAEFLQASHAAALEQAIHFGAKYFLVMDQNAMFFNKNALQELISLNISVVSPDLLTTHEALTRPVNTYENDDYKGNCFVSTKAYNAVFVDLEAHLTRYLSFNDHTLSVPDKGKLWAEFAESAQRLGIKIYACPMTTVGVIYSDWEISHIDSYYEPSIYLDMLIVWPEFSFSPALSAFVHIRFEQKMMSNLDAIYYITLPKDSNRRQRMEAAAQHLGIPFILFEAINGKDFTLNLLEELGAKLFVENGKPLPMTKGEIGCLFSHHELWQEIVALQLRRVLILEDDNRFSVDFAQRLSQLLKEVDDIQLQWDLIYVGRTCLSVLPEKKVNGTDMLTVARYSHGTFGYLISLEGAIKLIDGKPLQKMLPVDEYLPIMYDDHPEDGWKKHFRNRNLKAFASRGQLLWPPMYMYGSSTESLQFF